MASVKLNIPEEAKALTSNHKNLHKSFLVYGQYSTRFCKPNGKDAFYVISIMSCALILLLLYFKICIMEQNMAFVNRDVSDLKSAMDPTSGANGVPVLKSTVNSTDKENSLTLKLIRNRRQTESNGNYQHGQAWNIGGTFPDTMPQNPDNSHPSIHVTGITSGSVGNGDWFMWHSDSEPSNSGIEHTTLPFVQHTYVEILQPGYYFIYSQITYRDSNDFAIGHEVVRQANCGAGEDERLLNSIRTQITPSYLTSGERFYPVDSGYVGGVFYLSANDRVAVRPLMLGQQTRQFVAHTTGSYFGMFMLHIDHNAAIAAGPCRG